jgi:hypothetical protein
MCDSVVFSDEKKYNLDGPEGFSFYWHDLRNEKLIFSKRTQGGGSVMIWGGFSSKGKTELEFINSNMNSKMYKDPLFGVFCRFAGVFTIMSSFFRKIMPLVILQK